MFNYSVKVKIISILVLVALIITVTVVVRFNSSRSNDLQLVTQAKLLADGLEKYYAKFNTYPEIERTSVDSINWITEEGVNQEGNNLYFRKTFAWVDQATLVSNANNYSLEFELKNSWDVWGLDSNDGGRCRITANMVMQCLSN